MRVVSLVLVFGITFMFLGCKPEKKVGFVKIQQVFVGFTYKKELENNLKAVSLKRKNLLDSLELELNILSKQLNIEKTKDSKKVAEFETKKEVYFNKKKSFEEDNERMVKQYDENIVKQLNQYVKDYGEKNKYQFIYGADGSGSLMYADTTYDLTNKIIAYVNERFSGEKK
jgi:outer membrane protein